MEEPLKDILSIYNDKKSIFLYYFPKILSEKIKNYEYLEEDTLYLKDKIIVINKFTFEIVTEGTIIYSIDNIVTVKTSNQYSITIDILDYYIFYKHVISNTDKFNTLKSLIKLLE
tara:strand:+ start:330 stop:674 length:345 start_codon:yes stop_codon:yes gene_type:complete